MKSFSYKYLVVLGILSLVILISQLLIQKTIKDNDSDSRIINISGRQRMLSQKITKAALKYQNAKDLETYNQAKSELVSSANLWSLSHHALQYGNEDMNLTFIENSIKVSLLFEQIEPLFETIKSAVDKLAAFNFRDLNEGSSVSTIDQQIKKITDNEAQFLKLMNDITFQYDKEASMKVEKLSRSEYYLLGFTFMLILLEAIFIFRPMLQNVNEKEIELSVMDQKIKDSIEQLGQRDKEKTYAASQIKQANNKIAELRKLVYTMKDQISEKDRQTTLQLSNYLHDNAALSEKYRQTQSTVENQEKEISLLKKSLKIDNALA